MLEGHWQKADLKQYLKESKRLEKEILENLRKIKR